jgi:hypothetical protein
VTDLLVDRIYEGGRRGNAGDDPLNALLGVSNQGGFRILGSAGAPRLVVLTTSLEDPDWPDSLDHTTGRLTYYGDNKKAGKELHGTNRFGNRLLRHLFDLAHSGPGQRLLVPPVLVFAKTGSYRDMRFLGLAVPGAEGISPAEDLVAVWKTSHGSRFQNYRAVFTILDEALIGRDWLDTVIEDRDKVPAAPHSWQLWREIGSLRALKAPPVVEIRSRVEQEPETPNQCMILGEVRAWFQDSPVRFERCAGRIAELLLGNVTILDFTRPSRDGGRDAVGKIQVGGPQNGIEIDFALEAKCYSPHRSVGVKELSRLISRLRHRQFGILVTTSHLATQAYQEIRDDGHPIIVIAGRDIANILEEHGLGHLPDLRRWLDQF